MKEDIHNYARNKQKEPSTRTVKGDPDFRSPCLWKNELQERQLRTHADLNQSWKLNGNWSFGEIIWTT